MPPFHSCARHAAVFYTRSFLLIYTAMALLLIISRCSSVERFSYSSNVRLFCCLFSRKQCMRNCIKHAIDVFIMISQICSLLGLDMDHMVSLYFFWHADPIETTWSCCMSQLAEKEVFCGPEVSLSWLRNEFMFSFAQEDSVLHLFVEAKTLTPEKMKVVSSQLVFCPKWKGLCWFQPSKNLSISVFFQRRHCRNNLGKLLHLCRACIPDLHTQLWKSKSLGTKVAFWCRKAR